MYKKKNILITGSSRGIGLTIAKMLSKNDNVFITARNKKVLQDIFNKEACFTGYYASDLSSLNGCNDLFQEVVNQMGHIDVLINNAGLYVYNPVEKTTDEDISSLINVNILASYNLIKKVVPSMKKNKFGRIINIGSISGVVGEGNASLYSMTKSALTGLSKALALELAQDNITVNTINPGWVDTELINNEELNEDFSKDEIIEMIPGRRFVTPEEIASICAFLITDNAKSITGQSVNVCAGLSLG